MSELLTFIKKVFDNTIDFLKELSLHVPSSRTSRALLVGVAGAVVYFLLKKRRRLPPGPLAVPLLGNLFALHGKREPLYVTLDRWAGKRYGPVITLQFGPMRCVTLNRLEVVKEALVQKGADFAGRPQLCSLGVQTEGFKDIIFSDDSAAWRLHRNIATRALRHFLCGERLDLVIQHVMGMALDRMSEEKEAFDPHPYMSILMFHIIDTFCFGKMKDWDDPSLQRLSDIFDGLLQDIGNGLIEDVLPFLKMFPTQKFQKFSDRIGQFLDYVYLQVDDHRNSFYPDDLRDIVDAVLLAERERETEGKEDGDLFTPTHVAQTISDIFGGGVDTSRQTLDWALLFMAGHPEEQMMVQTEIDLVTGSRWPTSLDRPQLVYTEATLHEIMRLGSVVPLGIPHKTLCDTTVGGYDVPKNTMVMINLWALLHDPDKWDSANEFRPSRFIGEDGKLKTTIDSWLPFSTGRRACLGETVAKPELLLIFACLLKRFRVSLPSGVDFDPSPSCESLIVHLPKPFKIIVTER